MLYRKIRHLPVALAGAGILAGTLWLAAVPAAFAQPGPAGGGPASATGGVAKVPSQRAELAYWTLARMRAAKPADIIVVRGRPPLRPATGHPTGEPGSVPGGLPQGPAAGAAVAAPRTGGNPVAQFSLPFPYDSFTVPPSDAQTFPWNVNGALFFTNDGTDHSCSATSVGSASGTKNENEIWTAGHCVINTDKLDKHLDSSAVFVPAYNGNSSTDFAPFGEFTWTGGWQSATAWIKNRDLTEDEAAMTVGTSSTTGRTLGQAVGWDGFDWNQPVNQQFTALGYPAASPYNGNSMIQDLAATAAQDTGISGANPVQPIGIGNPMTPGSSGGAWNIGWSLTGPGNIDGHTDYGIGGQPNATYSPYQDTLSNKVRCFGASSC
jgi:V8-like Glu-specific endopeptidase